MGDGTLVEVDEFKLLGVTFSKDLSFDSHMMLFLTRFQNCLVLSRGAQEACPLMLCLTSIRPLSCHIFERFSKNRQEEENTITFRLKCIMIT